MNTILPTYRVYGITKRNGFHRHVIDIDAQNANKAIQEAKAKWQALNTDKHLFDLHAQKLGKGEESEFRVWHMCAKSELKKVIGATRYAVKVTCVTVERFESVTGKVLEKGGKSIAYFGHSNVPLYVDDFEPSCPPTRRTYCDVREYGYTTMASAMRNWHWCNRGNLDNKYFKYTVDIVPVEC